MARSKDIRQTTKFYTDILIRNYEQTDPDREDQTSINKTEVAAHTIEVWWQLFGELVAWAQAHFTGHAALTTNPNLVSWIENKLDIELGENSDIVEYLGWQFMPIRNFDENDTLRRLDELFDEDENELPFEILTTPALRKLIIELLMSRSSKSSFWRFELQQSLRALNYGQSDQLSTPEQTRRQGEPYSLLLWKHKAILKVYYFTGQGMKKYAALNKVADGIGQSPETLRSWEKKLLDDEFFRFELWSAEVSGIFEDDMSDGQGRNIPNYEEMGMFRGTYMTEMASFLLPQIKRTSFKEIREMLRFYRNSKKVPETMRPTPQNC
jgi:hypothetical protein